MGKSTISTGPFSIATLVYQRVWILWDLVAKLRWCGTLQRAVSITAFAVLWGDRFLPGFPSKNFRENPVGRDSGEVQEPTMPACSPWARNSHAECINWAFSMATWQIIRKICYITGWGLVASGMNERESCSIWWWLFDTICKTCLSWMRWESALKCMFFFANSMHWFWD
jgi:hypothetical protein